MTHIAASRDIAIPEPTKHKPAEQHIHCPLSAKIINLILEYFPASIEEMPENVFQRFHNELSITLGEQRDRRLTSADNEDTI